MKPLLPAFQHISECKMRHPLRKTAILSCLLFSLYISSAYADETPAITKLMQAGQYAEALKKTNAVLSKYPDDAQLRFIKGLILAEQNKSAEAITIFSKLIEDFPDLPEPYNNLAVLYAARGEYDKARATLDQAIRTNPTYATAMQNLGDVYAKMASQAYDKALQLETDNKAPQPRLILVQSLNGNVTGGTNPKHTVIARPAPPPEKPVQVAVAPQPKAPEPVAPPPVPTPAPAPAPAPVVKQPEAKPAPQEKPAQPSATTPPQAPVAKAPETKPEPKAEAKPAKTEQHAQADVVLATVNGWAKAWGDQNVKAYLGYYSDNFKPAGGSSRAAWATERRARIEDKGHIDVKVNAPVVRIEGNTATVRFRQGYTSNRLTVNSRKTMVLEKNGNKWLIIQEIAGR
jgi:tetratricopeptide (TPR) repeat protein